MREFNFRNVTLMAAAASCFIQIGAQLFAVSVIARTVAQAPPRSFAIFEGAYGYDSSGFWNTVPPITALLLVIALATNWKTRRRNLLLIALAVFVLGGVIAGVFVEPRFAEMIAVGYSDAIDPALQRRAAKWYAMDWAVWTFSLFAGVALLAALARPVANGVSRNLQNASAGFVLLISVACSQAQQPAAPPSPGDRRVINPPGIAPLVPAYSVAVRDGDFVFVSGLTGVVPGTQDIIAGGVGAQTRQTLENIRASLVAAGAQMSDVGECTVFLRDMADYAAMNAVYLQFFPTEPPARATVAVSALPRPAALVEIKCSARIRR